jgi:hypothetical protein
LNYLDRRRNLIADVELPEVSFSRRCILPSYVALMLHSIYAISYES